MSLYKNAALAFGYTKNNFEHNQKKRNRGFAWLRKKKERRKNEKAL